MRIDVKVIAPLYHTLQYGYYTLQALQPDTLLLGRRGAYQTKQTMLHHSQGKTTLHHDGTLTIYDCLLAMGDLGEVVDEPLEYIG